MVKLTGKSGHLISTKIGFSWTMLIFGFFLPMYRKDIKGFVVVFFSTAVIGFLFVDAILVLNVFYAIFYNELYIRFLLKDGFNASTEQDLIKLTAAGIYEESFLDNIVSFINNIGKK